MDKFFKFLDKHNLVITIALFAFGWTFSEYILRPLFGWK